MKKKLSTHDDTPSVPLAPKEIETQAPNYEGDVRETKYEVEEYISIHTDTQPTSKSVKSDYPIPDDDVDIYSVDTRIWDRMGELLDGAGGDAGPHTHNAYALTEHGHDEYLTDLPTHDHPHGHEEYADKQTLADHLANHPSGEGGGSYDDTELRGRVGQNESDIADLQTENNSQNSNIQANTTALSNKADKTAFEEHLANHPSGGGGSGDTLLIMTQAEYDALENPDPNTLYVVM